MRSIMRCAIVAAVLGLLATGRVRADLILVEQAAPGVDLNNIHVGQSFEIDTLMEGSNPNEAFNFNQHGGVYNWFTNSDRMSEIFGPNQGAPLTTHPALFEDFFTAVAAGATYMYDDFSGGAISTNLATYSPVSNVLRFTILPAASTVPEPASATLMGLGLAGGGLVGWRRSQRRAV